MSCYTLKVFGKELTFSTSRPFTESELSDPNIFIQELVKNVSSNKDTLNQLNSLLIVAEQSLFEQNTKEYPPIRATQRGEIYNIIKQNLASLGVIMHTKSENEMINMFGKGVKAAVKDGEIYILDSGKVDITAPVHELLHLIMSIYKLTDYKGYKNFLEKISKLPEFKEVEQNFLSQNLTEYEGLMGIDLTEEIFNRFMEQIIKDKSKLDSMHVDNESVYDFLDQNLSPVIQYAFSLKSQPHAISFLKATISYIPTFGTKIFFPQKMESTGFLSRKHYAIENSKIVNQIKEWAHPEKGKPQILEELECHE